MKFDILLTGVGGEGVLTVGSVLARAANIEGYYVRGVQLHGLAQRGGSIPTHVRFGSVSSPAIMQANADLIIAFEMLEAARACYFANKKKTVFVVNNYSIVPIYSNLSGIPYPSLDKIKRKINPFAKSINVFDANSIAEKEFGKTIFGNTILLGAAAREIPLKLESLRKAVEMSAPREVEENLRAFEIGIKLGGNK